MALTDSYQQRFGGIARLYGQSALEIFSQTHIAVIGIGGVGSWIVEALARSGIGELTLIDMDDLCVTNINRQLPALSSTIGQLKIEVMAARVYDINPECLVHPIDDFINADNISAYIQPEMDYVIDAIDSISAKAALLAYCRRHKIRVITMGGAGGQIDPTQIQVTDLGKTVHDPLLARLRQKLKQEYHITRNSKDKIGIDAVFSTEQLKYPQEDGSVCAAKSTATGSKRMDCASGFGAATVVTGTFAFVAVSHVLKKMLLLARNREV